MDTVASKLITEIEPIYIEMFVHSYVISAYAKNNTRVFQSQKG